MLACACGGVFEIALLGGAAFFASAFAWLRARFGGLR